MQHLTHPEDLFVFDCSHYFLNVKSGSSVNWSWSRLLCRHKNKNRDIKCCCTKVNMEVSAITVYSFYLLMLSGSQQMCVYMITRVRKK